MDPSFNLGVVIICGVIFWLFVGILFVAIEKIVKRIRKFFWKK